MIEPQQWSLYQLQAIDAPARFAKVLASDKDVVLRLYVAPPRVLWSGDEYPRLVVDDTSYDLKVFEAIFPHERFHDNGPGGKIVSSEAVEVREVSREEFDSWRPVLVQLVPILTTEEGDALCRFRSGQISTASKEVLHQLSQIEPSVLTEFAPSRHWPCGVELKDGSLLERVMFASDEIYIRELAMRKKDDPWAQQIDIADVTRVWESPYRLPVKCANDLYGAQETSMGGHIFVIVLSDGRRFTCSTGNVVDFPALPEGVQSKDIVEVLPHQNDAPRCTWDPPQFPWCIFREEAT